MCSGFMTVAIIKTTWLGDTSDEHDNGFRRIKPKECLGWLRGHARADI